MAHKISILIGSKSDYPVIEKGFETLKEFGIKFDVNVTSAHRSLKNTVQLAEKLHKSGTEIFIVGAGMAAHLPGVVAAAVPCPVIGVPIGPGTMAGLDSVLSIVQMPPGIPVAAVAVNGIVNAVLLAVQMFSLTDEKLNKQFVEYKNNLAEKVQKDNFSIQNH
jgi:5-(carboxyamino)imidazole ribonucleotide mutase